MVEVLKKTVECSCGSLLAYTAADEKTKKEQERTTHRRGEFDPGSPCTDYTEIRTIKCPACGATVVTYKRSWTEFD